MCVSVCVCVHFLFSSLQKLEVDFFLWNYLHAHNDRVPWSACAIKAPRIHLLSELNRKKKKKHAKCSQNKTQSDAISKRSWSHIYSENKLTEWMQLVLLFFLSFSVDFSTYFPSLWPAYIALYANRSELRFEISCSYAICMRLQRVEPLTLRSIIVHVRYLIMNS